MQIHNDIHIRAENHRFFFILYGRKKDSIVFRLIYKQGWANNGLMQGNI